MGISLASVIDPFLGAEQCIGNRYIMALVVRPPSARSEWTWYKLNRTGYKVQQTSMVKAEQQIKTFVFCYKSTTFRTKTPPKANVPRSRIMGWKDQVPYFNHMRNRPRNFGYTYIVMYTYTFVSTNPGLSAGGPKPAERQLHRAPEPTVWGHRRKL